MKLSTLRYLDRKIGVPLCNFFYFSEKVFHLRRRRKFVKENVKKILVIKIWGMGSIILASPLFQNLRDNFPEAQIWFLTQAGFENIYPSRFFDHIETMELRGFFRAVKDFLGLIFKFRRQKFDLIIDLEIVSRYTALISYLSGAKTTLGFEILGQNKDKLYDYTAAYHESRHISKTFLGMLESLGLTQKAYGPLAPEFSAADKQKLDTLFLEKKILTTPVVININASDLSLERRMPTELFAEIVGDIFKNYSQYSVVLIGSEKEVSFVEDFINKFFPKHDKIFNFAGLMTLPELFSLLKNTRLVISNDSGPAHVAVAYETPLVVFFGPETPLIYGPLNKNSAVFYSNLFCSPCISVYRDKKINCQSQEMCLKKLDIDEIKRTVRDYLK